MNASKPKYIRVAPDSPTLAEDIVFWAIRFKHIKTQVEGMKFRILVYQQGGSTYIDIYIDGMLVKRGTSPQLAVPFIRKRLREGLRW